MGSCSWNFKAHTFLRTLSTKRLSFERNNREGVFELSQGSECISCLLEKNRFSMLHLHFLGFMEVSKFSPNKKPDIIRQYMGSRGNFRNYLFSGNAIPFFPCARPLKFFTSFWRLSFNFFPWKRASELFFPDFLHPRP